MPYTDGLDTWLSSAKFPPGKTRAEVVAHIASIWGL